MTQDLTLKRRKPVLANIVWCLVLLFVVLPIAYVLSYAPAARWFGVNHVVWSDGQYHAFYVPADWLIDNTPLARPLFWWADVWGVQDAFLHEFVKQTVKEDLRRSNLHNRSSP